MEYYDDTLSKDHIFVSPPNIISLVEWLSIYLNEGIVQRKDLEVFSGVNVVISLGFGSKACIFDHTSLT
jgi:hypothetical protein